jgi:hypothetical protein
MNQGNRLIEDRRIREARVYGSTIYPRALDHMSLYKGCNERFLSFFTLFLSLPLLPSLGSLFSLYSYSLSTLCSLRCAPLSLFMFFFSDGRIAVPVAETRRPTVVGGGAAAVDSLFYDFFLYFFLLYSSSLLFDFLPKRARKQLKSINSRVKEEKVYPCLRCFLVRSKRGFVIRFEDFDCLRRRRRDRL